MSHRTCPVPGCGRALGTTRYGDPVAFCSKDYWRLNHAQRHKLWQAFRTWQRLERKYLALPVGERPPALLEARALAIKAYLEVRDDLIRVLQPTEQQLELAR